VLVLKRICMCRGLKRDAYNLEKGLTTPLAPCCKTWVYICVVRTSLWPSCVCTVRISAPLCSKCVAKEWRKVCGVTCLLICASKAAFLTARCNCFSSIWWRLNCLLSGSRLRACLSFEVKFAAVCLVFRQGRAYVVWLFPINGQ